MDVTFNELIKYSKMKNINGTNIKELLENKDLVHKVENLRDNDLIIGDIIEKLQNCNFSIEEINSIKSLFDNYIDDISKKRIEDILSERYNVSLDCISKIRVNGEDIYLISCSEDKDIVLKNNSKDNNTGYDRLKNYHELIFYSKDEIDKNPLLLEGLNIQQIENIRELINMNNIKSINIKYGLGITDSHQLICVVCDVSKGTIDIIDSSRSFLSTSGEIEELDLYDSTKNVAQIDEYASLVSTTELPKITDEMLERYDNSELEDKKVFKKNSKGIIGLSIILALMALFGIITTIFIIIF